MNNVKLITVFSLFLPIQGHMGIKRSQKEAVQNQQKSVIKPLSIKQCLATGQCKEQTFIKTQQATENLMEEKSIQDY